MKDKLFSKPYVMRRGTANKYNKTSLDEHRVLKNGSIVNRTISVKGKDVDESYDEAMIRMYKSQEAGDVLKELMSSAQ